MRVIKTITKSYDYGSMLGILKTSDDSEWRKVYLSYYWVSPDGILREEKLAGKETRQIEKMARTFINNQKDYFLWSY